MKTLTYAWRFLARSKAYTIINILGLSFSLACCLILIRYIHRELTVDTHCVDRDEVYAVKSSIQGNTYLGEIRNRQEVGIKESIVQACTRIFPSGQDYVMSGEHRFPARVLGIDSLFFRFFHYPVSQGNIENYTSESVWLMKDFARKVFGKENPVGKTIRYSNGRDLVVQGILDDPKNKTSVNFDLLVPISFVGNTNYTGMEFYSFMPGTSVEALNAKGKQPHLYNPSEVDSREIFYEFIPVKDIYLDSTLKNELPDMFSSGSYFYLVILAGVCLLLLISGLLNFINLYLIVLLKRGKEYGLKKVFGADGRSLFSQIWLENFLLIFVSVILAWSFLEVLNIPVRHLLDVPSTYQRFDILITVGILLVFPILTSVYPYLKYNYTSPVVSIRSIVLGDSSLRSRMMFLGIQYVLTCLLMMLSFYFNRQLQVMLHTEPGFRTKDVIIANLIYESRDYQNYTPEMIQQRMQRVSAIDAKLSACPDIEQWEASYMDILKGDYENNFFNKDGKKFTLNMRIASPRFFEVYDIGFAEGKLPEELNAESAFGVAVLNRAAMDLLGYKNLEDAVVTEETPMVSRGRQSATFPVMAVVDDYYSGHLALGKKPTVFFVTNGMSGDFYQIACVPGKVKEVLSFLREVEREVYGSEDFTYSLLEDDVATLYAQDRQVAYIYTVFAMVAIAVSCLGLFGLSLFDLRQRYREIGIRKVNGAQLKDIYRLLFRKYMFLLLVSFAVSIPIAVAVIIRYTENFAVKAPLGAGIFLWSLLLVSVISLGTLFWQVNRAARINPADVVKRE